MRNASNKLRRKIIRAPAVIGKCGDGREDVAFAGVLAEIAFQAPERGEDRRRHAEFLFDLRKQRRMAFNLLLAALHTIAGDHAVGEFQERLVEYALRAVSVDDALLELKIRRGSSEYRRRNSLREGFLFEVRQPFVEAAGVAARCSFGGPNVGRCECKHS